MYLVTHFSNTKVYVTKIYNIKISFVVIKPKQVSKRNQV
jgi:hypothetical protein